MNDTNKLLLLFLHIIAFAWTVAVMVRVTALSDAVLVLNFLSIAISLYILTKLKNAALKTEVE